MDRGRPLRITPLRVGCGQLLVRGQQFRRQLEAVLEALHRPSLKFFIRVVAKAATAAERARFLDLQFSQPQPDQGLGQPALRRRQALHTGQVVDVRPPEMLHLGQVMFPGMLVRHGPGAVPLRVDRQRFGHLDQLAQGARFTSLDDPRAKNHGQSLGQGGIGLKEERLGGTQERHRLSPTARNRLLLQSLQTLEHRNPRDSVAQPVEGVRHAQHRPLPRRDPPGPSTWPRSALQTVCRRADPSWPASPPRPADNRPPARGRNISSRRRETPGEPP